MEQRRVVITGCGLVTPAGVGVDATWEGLLSGQSYCRAVRWADLGLHGVAAPPDESVVAAVVTREGRGPDPLLEFGRCAAKEALAQTGAATGPFAGCVIGTSKGALLSVYHGWAGGQALSPYQFDPAVVARDLSIRYGMGAGAIGPVAACATGLVAIGQAWELVRRGIWSFALAGGVDASVHPGVVASYRRLGVIPKPEGDPARVARPFDVNRCGFVIGEGAGLVALESWEGAETRGGTPLAVVAGYAQTSEAGGLIRSEQDPEPLARAIQKAMEEAGCDAGEIDAISLHGTGTRPNDPLESRAIRLALGAQGGKIPCWSAKGAIGHLLGACGAVELVASCLILRDGLVPPTVNLVDQDPECELDLVRDKPRSGSYRTVLKTSLGFGGHCAAMILRRSEPGSNG